VFDNNFDNFGVKTSLQKEAVLELVLLFQHPSSTEPPVAEPH
jgi:hypothetical protein